MRDIYQVLREKELAVARVRQEVEALRFCLPMLTEGDAATSAPGSAATSNRWPIEVDPAQKPGPYQN